MPQKLCSKFHASKTTMLFAAKSQDRQLQKNNWVASSSVQIRWLTSSSVQTHWTTNSSVKSHMTANSWVKNHWVAKSSIQAHLTANSTARNCWFENFFSPSHCQLSCIVSLGQQPFGTGSLLRQLFGTVFLVR